MNTSDNTLKVGLASYDIRDFKFSGPRVRRASRKIRKRYARCAKRKAAREAMRVEF